MLDLLQTTLCTKATPPPVWHMRQPNLVHCHSVLHNYPFLLIYFIYFTLQVNPQMRIMADPCQRPAPEVNSCNAGLSMGVFILRLDIFAPQGPRLSVRSLGKNMVQNYRWFK